MFTEFLKEWRKEGCFSLSPSYSSRSGCFRGLEVSWGPHSRWYIPLPPKPVALGRIPATSSHSTWECLPPDVFPNILSFLQGPTPLSYNFSLSQEEVWGGGLPVLSLGKGKGVKGVCRNWRAGYREWECRSFDECVKPRWLAIKELLSSPAPGGSLRKVVAWDAGKVGRALLAGGDCGRDTSWLQRMEWQDPCVALWLLNPDSAQPESLMSAIEHGIAQGGAGGGSKENGGILHSPTLSCTEEERALLTCPENPACIKSLLLMRILGGELKRRGLYPAFKDFEMPVIPIFTGASSRGVCVDFELVSHCVAAGEARCINLEREGYIFLQSTLVSSMDDAYLHPHLQQTTTTTTTPHCCFLPTGMRRSIPAKFLEERCHTHDSDSSLLRLRFHHSPAMNELLYKFLGVASALPKLSKLLTLQMRAKHGGAEAAAARAMRAEGWPAGEGIAQVAKLESLSEYALKTLVSAGRALERLWEGGGDASQRTVHCAGKLCELILEHRQITAVVRAGKQLLEQLDQPHRGEFQEPKKIIKLSTPPSSLQEQQQRRVLHVVNPLFSLWTATGRVKMLLPALQSLPKRALPCRPLGRMRGDVGEHLTPPPPITTSTTLISLRHAICASPGHTLLAADYASAEARVLAHFSGEPWLVSVLSSGREDLFQSMAGHFLGKERGVGGGGCAVSREERELVKKLLYGIVYGAGEGLLSQELGCSRGEARGHIQRFHARFSALRKWCLSCTNGGEEGIAGGAEGAGAAPQVTISSLGGVRSLGGRLRHLAGLNSDLGKSSQAYASAARQAVNTICQSSVADIVKLGLTRVGERFCGGGGGGGGGGGEEGLLKGPVLQIHDELVWEVELGREREGGLLIKSCLEAVGADYFNLKVPLLVKLSTGASWGDLQPLEL